MKWWFRQQLYTRILVAIVVGAALGVAFGDRVSLIEPIGTIFIRLLKMLIVPLTFLTLISGITKLDSIRSLRSIGGLALLYYALSSLVAGAVGVCVALLIQPGRGMVIDTAGEATNEIPQFDFIDQLVQWIPTNPVEAFAAANMLQIIFFAIVVGIALLSMGSRAGPLVQLADDGAELMLRVTQFVMEIAPYGILALVANLVASVGVDMLTHVGKFIVAQYLALLILMTVVDPTVLRFLARVNPLRFYRNVSPALLVAASTTSSAATLPVSMEVAEKNVGAPEKVWGFTLPLGATVNMNGMAACIGVIAVFSCNVYHIPVTLGGVLQILFLGLALSFGTAGVKGAGIVTSTILLQTIGVPTIVIVPILVSIWPVLDIGNTCCNVSGDLVGTTLVASRFGMLDRDIFDSGNLREERQNTKP
ncbi:MAG TPA: dicarboxylate/amino acid:cation symporter [Thermoguttaceae bacterium]|nr:dicarboxylate/amino acid:cation symporter [Thermoguttaceae bacterium]